MAYLEESFRSPPAAGQESRRAKRIKLVIHNAVQSAFCHPESLCRMIYAKLKTLPEGIRK